MIIRKTIFSFAAVALAVASAATHKVTLYQPSVVNGTELKPGQYRLEVHENKAVLTNGKTQVEADVRTETADTKFKSTTVRFANGDGKMTVTEIRLGGTKTKLVFEN